VPQFVNWAAAREHRGYDTAMRVIPVIDWMNGCVVRGIAGRRSEYQPIKSRITTDARLATLAGAFVAQFGFHTVYVADLDAIMRCEPDPKAWKQISEAGLRLWLDAGIADSSQARGLLARIAELQIAADVVVGLESIESEAELRKIGQVAARRPAIFSLDLQNGRPLVRNAGWQDLSPLDLVKIANAAGLHDVIVLDLADVGTSQGTRTLDLCRQIRIATDTQTIIAGGGVRGFEDLKQMASAGCDAALVASALHDGRLTPEEVRKAENLPH
jgi:phosphoribosylformimino-5-aminoimidazole carboxamide ribotide isomerase